MRQPTWKQLLVLLGIATALMLLILWDQSQTALSVLNSGVSL